MRALAPEDILLVDPIYETSQVLGLIDTVRQIAGDVAFTGYSAQLSAPLLELAYTR